MTSNKQPLTLLLKRLEDTKQAIDDAKQDRFMELVKIGAIGWHYRPPKDDDDAEEDDAAWLAIGDEIFGRESPGNDATATDLFIDLLKASPTPELMDLVLKCFTRWHDARIGDFSRVERHNIFAALIAINTSKAIFDKTCRMLIKFRDDLDAFIESVEEAIKSRNASRWAIEWRMHLDVAKIDALMLQYALLFGFDDAYYAQLIMEKTTAAEELQNAFAEAKSWTNDVALHRQTLQSRRITAAESAISNVMCAIDFDKFCANIAGLDEFVLGDSHASRIRLSQQRVCSHIAYYIDKYKADQLGYVQVHEMIYSLLIAYPDEKASVIDLMNGKGLSADEVAAIASVDFAALKKQNTSNYNQLPDINNSQLQDEIAPTNHLTLPEHIQPCVVSTSADFETMMTTLRNVEHSDFPYVGVDLKRNAHAVHTEEEYCLLQIATRDDVFIVPLHTADANDVTFLCAFLLPNKAIVKVDCAIFDDIAALRIALPGDGSDALVTRQSVIDVRYLYIKTRLQPELKYAPLPQFCETLLGQTLTQRETSSLWTRMPLRKSQIDEAALDAYCLIMLVQKMKELFDGDIGALVTGY